MDLTRYSRQTVFPPLGSEGQKKLLESRVAVIGIGALGTVIANNLARAGVGFLRLIDRDYVELSNLQRQTLFNEIDAAEKTPKAAAACAHLVQVNSEIALEPVVADVNSSNVEEFVKDVDLVLDGSDNAEVRYLINEACHKHHVPWVYGGALGSSGTVMNILPGGPCYRCLSPHAPEPGSYPTCSTAGVLNMVTGIVGSVESAEAVKILTGSPKVSKKLFAVDVWNSTADYFQLKKDPDCPVCGKGEYELLGVLRGAYTAGICGTDSVQVVPGAATKVDFDRMAEGLKAIGSVKRSRFLLSFEGPVSFDLFADGRAIIKNVKDEASAKSIYSEYIGL